MALEFSEAIMVKTEDSPEHTASIKSLGSLGHSEPAPDPFVLPIFGRNAPLPVPPRFPIRFRQPLVFWRRKHIRLEKKIEEQIHCQPSHEAITLNNENNDLILFDAPKERIWLSKFRKWQIFPGRTEFCFDGRLMHSPERATFYGSCAAMHLVFMGFIAFV
jgi:hypothetical protein